MNFKICCNYSSKFCLVEHLGYLKVEDSGMVRLFMECLLGAVWCSCSWSVCWERYGVAVHGVSAGSGVV